MFVWILFDEAAERPRDRSALRARWKAATASASSREKARTLRACETRAAENPSSLVSEVDPFFLAPPCLASGYSHACAIARWPLVMSSLSDSSDASDRSAILRRRAAADDHQ